MKTFSVSAESVYDAWLNPESVKTWMCPADIVSVPNPKIDAKVGGKFQFDMKIGEDRVIPHSGEYKILERPTKIQFTWVSVNTNNEDSLVTITISPLDSNRCELKLVHELLPSEESHKDHEGGWNNILKTLHEKISK